MSMTISIDDGLYNQARIQAQTEKRSIARQIEWWAMVGKAALDNPDLPIDFIHNLLVANSEDAALTTPFVPEGQRDNG